MSHIFISYDHTDSDFVENMRRYLEEAGITTWVDQLNLQAGTEWRSSIDAAIVDAKAVIVVVTPESVASHYVTYEWAFALGCRKPIIPLMLRQTNLHERLSSIQYVDFSHRIHRPWATLIQRLKNL